MSTQEDRRITYIVRPFNPTNTLHVPILNVDAGELLVPESGSVRVNIEGVDGLREVRLEVKLIVRRYCVTGLHITGNDVGLEDVRRLPIAEWLRDSVASSLIAIVDDEVYTADDPMPDADPAWTVAMIYSTAHVLGLRPTAHVAERLGISPTAAAQRVRRARQKGFLPPTTAGKAS